MKPAFRRGLRRLAPAQAAQLRSSLRSFVADLREIEEGRIDWFRLGLRVKKVVGASNVYEMSWAPDGRATFAWGSEQVSGKRHVVWLQVGSHDILP